MKKFLNLVLCIGISFEILLLPFQAYAQEREILYQDGQFILDSEEIIDENLEWMPGDTIRQTYTVRNQSKDKVTMYLAVSTNMEMSAEMQEWVEISISSKQSGWLHVLQSADTDKVVINEQIEIGTFVPGQFCDLTIDLSLSENADNRCKNFITALEYELVAEVVESGNTETDSEEFGETETTEADNEDSGETEKEIGTEVDTKMETEEATDSETDEVTVPDTGDSTTNPYLALLVASVLLLLWSYKEQKK